ncbi:hypothetical protein Tco_1098681 [Tanacetum coccineum]
MPSGIRSFLGLAGYYRRFIVNVSKIAKPLTSLTQKNKNLLRSVESRIRLCTHAKRQGRERDSRNAAWPGLTNGKEGRWRYLVHSGADKTYYDLRDMYGGHVWRRILLPMSRVLWAEILEIRSIEPELVQETTNKVILIKEKLKAARDCQKSYVDNMRKHLELKLVIK